MVLAVSAVALVAAGASRQTAPDGDSDAARSPAAVICAADLDQVLNDLDYVLRLGGAEARMQQLRGIITSLNDLQGMDRGRPVGLLLYPPSAGAGDPDAIAFVPVTSMEDLQVSLKISNQVSLAPLEEEGRWELRGPDNAVPIRVQDGYAFVTQKGELLDGPLPDVAALTAPLAGRYDLGLLILREGLPQAALDQAIAKLHADSERDRERRPGESDAEHVLRGRISRSLEQLIEQALVDFEQVSIGLTISAEQQQAELEALLDVRTGGGFAGFLQSLTTSRSQFAVVDSDAAALSASSAWTLSGEGAEIVSQVLQQVRKQVGDQLQQDFTASSSADHPVRQVLDALDATVDAGRMDGMVAFAGDRPGGMVLVGAAHLEDAADVAHALEQILPYVAQSKDIASLELKAFETDGVSVHRIVPAKVRKQDERLYGPDAALYVGVGGDAIWIALGGDDAPRVLTDFITASASSADATSTAPPLLALDLHLSTWIGLAGNGGTGEQRGFVEAARIAFADPDQDGLRAVVTPQEDGLRIAVQADEGYIRLLGLALADRLQRGN